MSFTGLFFKNLDGLVQSESTGNLQSRLMALAQTVLVLKKSFISWCSAGEAHSLILIIQIISLQTVFPHKNQLIFKLLPTTRKDPIFPLIE